MNYLPVSARFGNVEAFFIGSTGWPFGGRPFREDEAGEEEGDDGEGKLHFFSNEFRSVVSLGDVVDSILLKEVFCGRKYPGGQGAFL